MPVHLSYSSTATLPPPSLLSTSHVFNSYLAYIGPVKRDEPTIGDFLWVVLIEPNPHRKLTPRRRNV
jgi:hypothetical protein